MIDVYSIGEMLIDFIPGSEPASYMRRTCKCSDRCSEKRIVRKHVLQSRR